MNRLRADWKIEIHPAKVMVSEEDGHMTPVIDLLGYELSDFILRH